MSFLRKAKHYLTALAHWELAGKPRVTDEVYAFRRGQCNACDQRDPEDKCRLCGCALYPTPLGDKLRWATEQCPLAPPRWKATWQPPKDDEPEIPLERRALAWVSQEGKPVYGDIAELTPGDMVITDAWLVEQAPFPDCEVCVGVAKKHFHAHELIAPDFTGLLDVAIDFESDLKALTWKTSYGKIRFEAGKPVELLRA
jgi:hypothetical protein